MGFFFGHLGDTLGRKKTLLITIFLMSLATFGIGLIPSNSKLALTLLIICRLLQGFATSGEYPGGLALLGEQAEQRSQAFVSSFGIFATGLGCFCGALGYELLLHIFSYQQILQFAWRIPFLMAAPLGVIGFVIRKNVAESAQFMTLKKAKLIEKIPLRELFSKHWRNILVMLSILILTNILIYVDFLYFNNYSVSTRKLMPGIANHLYLLVTLTFSFSILLFGFLADYVQPKSIMLLACILLLITVYPIFKAVSGSALGLQFVAQIWLAFLIGMISGSVALVITHIFPVAVRYSGLSFVLNMAASIFGGTAPLIFGELSKQFFSFSAPLLYLIPVILLAAWNILVNVKNIERKSKIYFNDHESAKI